MASFKIHHWKRDAHNPILRPQEEFDAARAMNPFAIRQGDLYYLFYAGAGTDGKHRICLATAKVGAIDEWQRHGVILDSGPAGNFDSTWCVLPSVHYINGRWHLYYTGRNTNLPGGLQSFTGIGLAFSNDLFHWTRYSSEPVIDGGGFKRWAGNKGVAGGGRILELPQPDGRILYRMYYTIAPGKTNPNLLIDQEKHSAIIHSYDGIEWFDRRIIISPRDNAGYENAATIALNIWREGDAWRAIYAGIGSQFGAYSICEAESKDGLNWERGEPGENLALPPQGDGWESQMTEYPNVIEENGKLRLFYCGNGYGKTGIGTAIAEKFHILD